MCEKIWCDRYYLKIFKKQGVAHGMTGSQAAWARSGARDVARDRAHVTQPEDKSGPRLDPRVPHTPRWTRALFSCLLVKFFERESFYI